MYIYIYVISYCHILSYTSTNSLVTQHSNQNQWTTVPRDKMAHTSLAILESKPEVGSSRKTTIGCEMSAKATLTRLASALRPKRSRKPFPQWVLQGSQSSQPCGCQGTCPPEMPRLNTLPITLSDCNYDSCRTSHVPVMTCNECFFLGFGLTGHF